MLMKSRSVLKYEAISLSVGRVRFAARDEDTGLATRVVFLSCQDFEDLGQPEQITVTIEPGDKINS